jgi:hypothetical protein
MADFMVFNIQSLLLWGAALAVLIASVILYIFRGRKREKINEKVLMFGFASYLLGYFLFYVIMTFIWFTLLPGHYDIPTNTFYADLSAFENVIIGNLLKISFIFLLLGVTGLIFAFEFNIRKMRFSLTLLNLILLTVYIIISFNLTTYADICLMPAMIANINMYFLIILILYFTKSAQPEFKAVSSLVCYGFFFILYSFGFCAPEFTQSIKLPLIIAPIICFMGAIICISPTLMKEQRIFKLSLNRTLWLGLGLLSIIIQNVVVVFALYFQLSPNFWAGAFLFEIFFIILLIRILKYTRDPSDSFKKKPSSDILSILTKPKKVTEEEVSISKERQTCLVCKGKLGGMMFICSECGAFYCAKCSESLTNLENACWVCEAPFDKSKAVKFQGPPSSSYIEETGKKKNKIKKN